MVLLKREQLEWFNYAWVGLSNVSLSGSSINVTSALGSALNTAGDNGVAVPLRVAGLIQSGLVVTSPDNTAILRSNQTKQPFQDSKGNEVYGRLTHSSGVYTLSFYVLVDGVETAYSFANPTAGDFYVVYQFDTATLPRNHAVSINSRIIQQDPASTASRIRSERLTVTALNTLSELTQAPTLPTNIYLLVNGKIETPYVFGSAAAFTVSGTAVNWNVAGAEYSLQTTFDVIAYYW